MKILHLVLYSKSDEYDRMKSITNSFYKNYKNVDTYYYYFDNTISNNYEIKENDLLIKGTETYIPGILDKTIKALQYFKIKNRLNDYDYVLRSNVSSVINFDKLIDILLKEKEKYDYGCYIYKRPPYKYSSGTSILLNIKTINFILNNLDKLDYSIIDDYAIGKLIFTKIDKVKFCNIRNKVCFNYKNEPINNYVIFRNKTVKNRNTDVLTIKKITELIEKNNKPVENNINKNINKNLKKKLIKKINKKVTIINIKKNNIRKIKIINVNKKNLIK